MIEQWYAVHKTTGEVYQGAGGCCFDTQNGLNKSIRSLNKLTSHWHSVGMSVKVCPPPEEWIFKKVELK